MSGPVGLSREALLCALVVDLFELSDARAALRAAYKVDRVAP